MRLNSVTLCNDGKILIEIGEVETELIKYEDGKIILPPNAIIGGAGINSNGSLGTAAIAYIANSLIAAGLSGTAFYVAGAEKSGTVNLGSAARKWNTLYAATGTINTSDRNEKTEIAELSEKQEELFNALQPAKFKFINGTSGRVHYGFIAQDVEKAMTDNGISNTDFAGLCKDENESGGFMYGLRYSEFIALNTHMIQKLSAQVDELEAKIKSLEEKT